MKTMKTMKKLNITKKQYSESKYFQKKYGTLKYVSESGKLYRTSKGNVLRFSESKVGTPDFVEPKDQKEFTRNFAKAWKTLEKIGVPECDSCGFERFIFERSDYDDGDYGLMLQYGNPYAEDEYYDEDEDSSEFSKKIEKYTKLLQSKLPGYKVSNTLDDDDGWPDESLIIIELSDRGSDDIGSEDDEDEDEDEEEFNGLGISESRRRMGRSRR